MTTSTLPFNLSWKAILAFLFPLISALGVALASWLVSGDLGLTEIRAAAGGLVLSALSLLGAYLGKPAPVVHEADEQADLHDALGA
jgi:hypothetical protein